MSDNGNICVRRKYMRQFTRPAHIRCIQATHRCVGPCIDCSRLFGPGEKEVRNPEIAKAMRRIAMCEQAGTGMRMMREAWQDLAHGYLASAAGLVYDCHSRNDRVGVGKLTRGKARLFAPLVKGSLESRITI